MAEASKAGNSAAAVSSDGDSNKPTESSPSNNDTRTNQNIGNEIAHGTLETQLSDPVTEDQLSLDNPAGGNEIVPLSPEMQLAVPSTENQLSLGNPSEVIISGGNYPKAHFGPQTNNQIVNASDYRNAKIVHHHHYYGGTSKSANPSEASTSTEHSATRERNDDTAGGELTQLSDTISICNGEPLREGTRIYKGIQTHISGHRFVAIKLVAFHRKTLQEVKNLLKLAYHQNVIQIIESREYQSATREIYIAMELCNTANLHDYIVENRNGQIPFDHDQMMSFTKQLVAGIAHIHANNIIHGDVKPGNILLSEDKKTLKVSDFGLSRELQLGNSSTRVSICGQGTDGYRAPETYSCNTISLSSDIFCLAIVLFMLWANGKHPYGDDMDLLNYNIKKNIGLDLSGVMISGVKKEQFLDLIKKMLHPDPKLRPTIQQVAQHLFFINELHSPVEGAQTEGIAESSDTNRTIVEQIDDVLISSERTFKADEETLPKTVFQEQEEGEEEEPIVSNSPANENLRPSSSCEEFRKLEVSSVEKRRSPKAAPANTKTSGSQHERRKVHANKEGWMTASEHQKTVVQDDTSIDKGARRKEFLTNAYFTSNTRAERQRHTYSHMHKGSDEKESSLQQRRTRSEFRRENIKRGSRGKQALSPSISFKNATFSFSSNLRGRLDHLGLNSKKLCEWRIIVRFKGKVAMEKTVKEMHNGCRLYHGDGEKWQTHSLQTLHVNSEDILIHRLREIKLPKSNTLSLFSSPRRRWLGLAIWFDKKTSELRGASYGQTSLYFFDCFANPMSKVMLSNCEEVCILSMKNYVDWLERGNLQGVSMANVQGPTLRTHDEAWQSADLEIELFPNVIVS